MSTNTVIALSIAMSMASLVLNGYTWHLNRCMRRRSR